MIETWLNDLDVRYEDRILPITEEIADTWGRLNAASPLPIIDGLLAATAIVHEMTFVTRNRADVARTGVAVLNPFEG
jgi:predicted nucleic acid-binding protein